MTVGLMISEFMILMVMRRHIDKQPTVQDTICFCREMNDDQ